MTVNALTQARPVLPDSGTLAPGSVLNDAQLVNLPPPIRRYLRFTGVLDRPIPATVQVRQAGQLRLKPNQRWLPFTAEQSFTIGEPGFRWLAHVKLLPCWRVRARETFTDGHGRTGLWLAPLLRVIAGRGPAFDQAELQRYLCELIFCPGAFALPNIRWDAFDADAARATITAGDVCASAIFSVASDGSIADIVAPQRFRPDGRGAAQPTRWSFSIMEYGDCAGLRLPAYGRASWHLADGVFPCARTRYLDIQYDPADRTARAGPRAG